MSDKELLEDISFDRGIVPKDQEGDLLVSLLRNKAYDENTAVELSKYPIKEKQLNRLIKEDRIKVFSKSPAKVYLTGMGKIVAGGEFVIREIEKKTKR